ncbi:hypothetical protein ACFYN0_26445 [Streptomyces sp. NPDC006704]
MGALRYCTIHVNRVTGEVRVVLDEETLHRWLSCWVDQSAR